MPLPRQSSRNRALTRLLGAFGLLNVAEWGFVTALSIYAFRVGGTLDVGLIGLRLLAGAASSAVLAPLFASRRGVLSAVTLLRSVLLGGAALLVLGKSPFAVILLVVVVDSVVAAIYRPAQSRLMPSLARSPQELTRAVAGTSMAKTIGQAAGAMLGGAAVEVVSPGTAMAGEAGVMLIAFVCGFGLSARVAGDTARRSHSVRAGLAAFPGVLGDRNAWPLVIASVLRTLLRGLWNALLVVVALRLLRAGSSSVGLLQAAAGVGVLIALPVTATQIGRQHLALPCVLSFIAAGVAVGLVGADPGLAIVALLACVWGLSMAVADATSLSLLHRLLNVEAFSRTVGVMESLKLLSEGCGALLAPALVALFGLRTALVIGAVPLPVLMLVGWVRISGADQLAVGRGAMVGLLHRVGLLSGLDMASIEQLAAYAEPVEVDAGADVFDQGDAGDLFYVIQSGVAQVLIDGHVVREIGAGDDFGERALLRDTPRTATVHATTHMELLAIERDAFLEVITGEQDVQVRAADARSTDPAGLLAEQPAFENASSSSLRQLVEAGQRQEFLAGAVIFEAGDSSNAVYLILDGQVEIYRDGRLSAVLEAGELFGELSVIHGTPRTARVLVREPLTALVLPAAAVVPFTGLRAGERDLTGLQ